MNQSIMILAGEASGDLHGSSLVKQLLKMNPEIRISGIGGAKMEAAGMKPDFHIRDMAFLGFTEVVRHIPFIRKVQKKLLSTIQKNNIELLVLIDYPGFNLNFAKKAKKLGVKIVYYISPQLWAWGSHRVKKIRKLIDKMIVVFPFEKKFYSHHNIDSEYVGHPLIERISEYSFLSEEEFYSKYNLDLAKKNLLLLPGSRHHELELIFPDMLKAANKIAKKYDLNILVACASNLERNDYEKFASNINYVIIDDGVYSAMKHSKLGLIKSGTSSLEASLNSLPSIIVYKTSRITFLIGRLLVKIKSIAMPNIILGENFLPELIQNDFNADNLFEKADELLSDDDKYNLIKEKMKNVADILDESGASSKVASIINKIINEG